MALKDLSTGIMVHLTEPWLDPKRERPKLQALPHGQAVLPMLEAAQQGLLSTQKQGGTIAKEIAEIQAKQAVVDKKHDRKLRGVNLVLTGLAELADTPEEAQKLLDVRDTLQPNGISATQKKYAEEAGDIPLIEARLSPDHIGFLKKIPILGGKLWEAVQAWFGFGRELGVLDDKRKKLEAAMASGTLEAGTSGADVVKARNQWIRVVRHMETGLDLDGASEEVVEAILGPVRRAENDAARRVVAGPTEAVPAAEKEPPK